MVDSYPIPLHFGHPIQMAIEPFGVEQLRMSFPTVTSNTSPMSVLPSWVEVLGKKIDKIQAELDPGGICCIVACIKTGLKIDLYITHFHHEHGQDRLRDVKTTASTTLLP